MTPRELCESYLAALNEGSVERVLALFEREALVVSPLYGTMPAAVFYKELFSDTQSSQTRFVNLFESSLNPGAVALQFHYRWTLSSGEAVEFDCVDVFDLNAEGSLFSGLKIIYDTAPLRAKFEAARG